MTEIIKNEGKRKKDAELCSYVVVAEEKQARNSDKMVRR